MSWIDDAGAEWETRRISILGVAKSFISQLSVGQDLTRVSLPCVFLYPYSVLELGGSRLLSHIEYLYLLNREKDPINRMIAVVRWYLTFTQRERFEKKPYNPLLGETHECSVESKESGVTHYYAEQVCHHPPVSAYVSENKVENISTVSNITFAIKFHGNSASVKTDGLSRVDANNFDEQYTLSKAVPDVLIKNVILGTKRIVWDGEVSITCQKTGYKATFTYKEEGWYEPINVIRGVIAKLDNPEKVLYTFGGPLSGTINITNQETNQTDMLIEGKISRKKIQYPPPELWEEFSSLNVWKDVSRAIVDNDMVKGDTIKVQIENAQRKRRTEGQELQPRYFKLNPNTSFWEIVSETVAERQRLLQKQVKEAVTDEGLHNVSSSAEASSGAAVGATEGV